MSSSSSGYVPSVPIPVFTGSGGGCGPQRENQAGELGLLRPEGGVWPFNGGVVFSSRVGLRANGFNVPFSTNLAYDSAGGGASRGFGINWVPLCLPRLVLAGGVATYERGALEKLVFVPLGGGAYQATYFVRDQLSYNSGSSEYTLTAPDGRVETFDGEGKLISFASPGGRTATVAYSGGLISSVSVVDGSDSWEVEFVAGSALAKSQSPEEEEVGWISESFLNVGGHPVR